MTVACCFLEFAQFQNLHAAAPLSQDALVLEAMHHQRDRRSLDAEHIGEHFLRNRQHAGVRTFLQLEELAAKAPFDVVQSIAGCDALDL